MYIEIISKAYVCDSAEWIWTANTYIVPLYAPIGAYMATITAIIHTVGEVSEERKTKIQE